jgi:hypothetical protein
MEQKTTLSLEPLCSKAFTFIPQIYKKCDRKIFPSEKAKTKPALPFRIGGAAVLLHGELSTRSADTGEITIAFCSVESFFTRAADSQDFAIAFGFI